MKGILILAHGSKNKESIDILNEIISMVKERLKDSIVEGAFISFFKIDIEHGLKSLINKGVREIYIIPYFLFEGVHVKEDIPRKVNEVLKDYPDVKYKIGKTLGTDIRLSEIVADRINELIN